MMLASRICQGEAINNFLEIESGKVSIKKEKNHVEVTKIYIKNKQDKTY